MADRRGFRKILLSSLIETNPKQVRDEILAAHRLGRSVKGAAKILGISEQTIHRYIERLEMQKEIEAAAEKGAKEGWLQRGRPAAS